MTIARPRTVDGALDALAAQPDAHLLAGGTDLVVEVNLGRRRPDAVVALRRVDELRGHRVDATGGVGGSAPRSAGGVGGSGPRSTGVLELGALVTYTAMEHDLADLAPGLAMAARTVGSPQIRNAGTLGGNLGTASPAGDTLPWLAALDAEVVLAGPGGDRTLPLVEFVTGPKRTARQPGEVIRGVRVPRVEGPQHVAKVGPRNAMVIAVASLAVVVDTTNRRVRVGLGAVGPVPVRAAEAEHVAGEALDWGALTCPDDALDRFAAAVAAAASPIDDHRSTAAYRRHAVGVLARRSLRRCLAA